MKKYKKHISTVFKVLVTLTLLYLVFNKIDFKAVFGLIKKSNAVLLLGALLAFICSQWLSSLRLLKYFNAEKYNLAPKSNHILYLIGMFYNFFIPGGIGGDAYKVYVLHQKFNWNVKKLSFAVLNDRLSGLLALLILIQILLLFIVPPFYKSLIPLTILLTVLVSYFIFNRLFPQFKTTYFKALAYSIAVQSCQILSVFFILQSLHESSNLSLYFAVFLGSSILSVLSFSGIGVREWLFLQASEVFDFNPQVSVSVALLFSFLTAFVSLFGIFFQFKKYNLQTVKVHLK